MYFQKQFALRSVDLEAGQTVELPEDTSDLTTLVIRRPLSGEDSGLEGTDCVGTALTEEVVTEKVRPQFEIKDSPRAAVIEIGRRVSERVHCYVLRTVSVLRWRTGATGHQNPIRYARPLHWSDDRQTWSVVPGMLHLEIDAGIPFMRMDDNLRASFVSLVKSGATEPLGHEVFHEAWNRRSDCARSSLLMAVAAAEIGLKAFVGLLVPNAEWLAFHAPTPPLTQMLTDYLPILPVKQTFGVGPFIPKPLLDVLKKGVKLRNETAHAKGSVSPKTLKEILVAVNDLLYLLDFYSGQVWAFDHISHSMKEAIRAEVQKQKFKT